MGEPVESRFRRGEISPKAAAKWGGGILRQTRVQPSKMADFDDKGGGRDQGRGYDRGDVAGGRRHIDHKQSMGSPAHAGGAPSKGGGAGAQRQPTRRGHIDDASLQRPKYAGSGFSVNKDAPPGVSAPAKSLSAWKGKKVGKGGKGLRTPKRVAGGGGNPSNPNQYGDPGSRRYG